MKGSRWLAPSIQSLPGGKLCKFKNQTSSFLKCLGGVYHSTFYSFRSRSRRVLNWGMPSYRDDDSDWELVPRSNHVSGLREGKQAVVPIQKQRSSHRLLWVRTVLCRRQSDNGNTIFKAEQAPARPRLWEEEKDDNESIIPASFHNLPFPSLGSVQEMKHPHPSPPYAHIQAWWAIRAALRGTNFPLFVHYT